MMYQLSRNTENMLQEPSNATEKEDHNVNLEKRHWKFLDELANHPGSSRNKALREILDAAMEGFEDVK